MIEKRKYLKENIFKKLNAENSAFLDNYFDMIFIEMKVLHSAVFHDEVYNIFCNNDAQKI